jgi:hypothetical protein
MTISTGILLATGLLDILLLLISYGTYRRVRNLQEAYDKGVAGT